MTKNASCKFDGCTLLLRCSDLPTPRDHPTEFPSPTTSASARTPSPDNLRKASKSSIESHTQSPKGSASRRRRSSMNAPSMNFQSEKPTNYTTGVLQSTMPVTQQLQSTTIPPRPDPSVFAQNPVRQSAHLQETVRPLSYQSSVDPYMARVNILPANGRYEALPSIDRTRRPW